MQWVGSSGGTIGNLLAEWEQAGIFTYLLPFLIIFALIFAILSKMDMFKSKAVNAVISLAVGLMALQFDFVPRFFSEVFPRLGVGISLVLVILILVGLFVPDQGTGKNVVNWILAAIGFIIALVVLINSGSAVGYDTGYWFQENWGNVLLIVIVLGALALIIFTSSKSDNKGFTVKPSTS